MLSNNLSKSYIVQEYSDSLQKARQEAALNKYNSAMLWYKYACRVAWEFPILTAYSDDEVEKEISQLTNKLIQPCDLGETVKKGVVFYCGWLGDNMALIEQYLYYFIENNIPTLLVVEDKAETSRGKHVLNQVKKSGNVTLFIPTEEDPLGKVIAIRKAIRDFSPELAFMHFWPNDVIGLAVFSGVFGIKRFFIDHADHLFWIGKSCTDFIIEFRRFGIKMSTERRMISFEKILHIPFYPINNNKAFKGFPFNPTGKLIAISGGNLYKYYLDEELDYFKVIAKLLVENSTLVFCLCGVGNEDRIRKIFISNKVGDRFFYLGDRKDFYALVSRCDLMFESYPLKGGLVRLFAIEQGVPVIGITASYNKAGSIQETLELADYKEPVNFEEFYNYSTKLIRSSAEREKLVEILSNNRFNKANFSKGLELLIKGEYDKLRPVKTFGSHKIDDEVILNEYLKIPNSTKYYLIFRKLNILKGKIGIAERLRMIPIILWYGKSRKKREVIRLLSFSLLGR